MKRLCFAVIALVIMSSPAYPEDYDPQNTILALNMAIVSIHRIVTAKDRLTLDQEYKALLRANEFYNRQGTQTGRGKTFSGTLHKA